MTVDIPTSAEPMSPSIAAMSLTVCQMFSMFTSFP
nr:MAG TPA: hypothetical protein [Caudoviricetes sp.]